MPHEQMMQRYFNFPEGGTRMKKRILSMLLTIVMVVGLLPGVTLTASAADSTVTLYFKNTDNWTTVNIYAWSDSDPVLTGFWPGSAMTDLGDGTWKYDVPAEATMVIFNNGSTQTADLTIPTAGENLYDLSAGTWSVYGTGSDTPDVPDIPDDPDVPDAPDDPSSGSGLGDENAAVIFRGTRTDLRDESVYTLMITRFYDGDTGNNVHCWDDGRAGNPDSDPAWRGDFKGLAEKLDYIKALGFTAVRLNSVAQNVSGYDYHGEHPFNLKEIDFRYESDGFTYEDLIDACHARGLKVIQSVVLNNTSNFGEENLRKLFELKEDAGWSVTESLVPTELLLEHYPDYAELTPAEQFQARMDMLRAQVTPSLNADERYHRETAMNWDTAISQQGAIAGDCIDLNTENPEVALYLAESCAWYAQMGVDAVYIPSAEAINRWTFNEGILPLLNQLLDEAGLELEVYYEINARFADVWNKNNPSISVPFYSWAETETAWQGNWNSTHLTANIQTSKDHFDAHDTTEEFDIPTSSNALLDGITYHAPDYSQSSGMKAFDFNMMWNFANASRAFGMAQAADRYMNDATWNIISVDNWDYGPDRMEKTRYSEGPQAWAENLNLMFTFRGIPSILYGTEVEFAKGQVIDVGPNKPLSQTGRAYFGDYLEGTIAATDFGTYEATGKVADTLDSELAQHIRMLNELRRAIPALRKGQYTTDSQYVADRMAFIKRYTNAAEGIDSLALVAISGGATFKNIPNGRYVDAVSGNVIDVTNGTLAVSGVATGDLAVYVCCADGFTGLDAQLSAAESILRFNVDGDTTTVKSITTKNGKATLPAAPALPVGHNFLGWIVNGETYQPGDTVEISVDSMARASLKITPAASLTIGGTTTEFATFYEAKEAAAAGTESRPAEIKLLANCDVALMPDGTTDADGGLIEAGVMTIDLNGFTLSNSTDSAVLAINPIDELSAPVVTISGRDGSRITGYPNPLIVWGDLTITGSLALKLENASSEEITSQYGTPAHITLPSAEAVVDLRGCTSCDSWTIYNCSQVKEEGEWVDVPVPAANILLPDGGYLTNSDGTTVGEEIAAQATVTVQTHRHVWSYSANGNTITAICSGTVGTCPVEGKIATIKLNAPEVLTYDGAEKTVTVTQSPDGVFALPEVSYTGDRKSVGTHIASLTYGGKTASVSFAIVPVSLANAELSVESNIPYTGSAITPDVTVKLGSNTLTAADYDVAYSGNIKVGEASVTITGKGNYKDSASATFTIVKAAAPAIQWPAASDLTYGQKLSESTLTSEDTNGTFAWQDGTVVPAVTNNGYVVVYTPKDMDNYDYSGVVLTRTIDVTVNNDAAAVETAPTPKALTYTGGAQDLINAGSANGGEMQYALGDTAPADDGDWSADIPTGTNAGTYMVWYRVKGDNNHSDAVPACVEVSIDKVWLDVTVDSLYAEVGDVCPEPTYTITGFVNGETDGVITGTPVLTYDSTPDMSEPGSYIIDISTDGMSATNYEFNPIYGELAVLDHVHVFDESGYSASGDTIFATCTKNTCPDNGNVKLIIISAPDNAVYEQGSYHTASLMYDSQVQVDSEAIVYSDDPVDAGTYTASITYGGVTASVTYDVAKRPLTIKVDSKSLYVGAGAPEYTYTVTGWGENYDAEDEYSHKLSGVTATCEEADLSKTGSYEITISGTPVVLDSEGNDVSANYTIATENGTLTVSTRPSSGGGRAPTYRPTIEKNEGGDTAVSNKNPEKGDKVTITTEPDKGYVVGKITVTDKNGSPVEVIDNGDGTFTYVQPSGKVTIEVEYVPAASGFMDVAEESYYYDAVNWASASGITSGTSATTFGPDNHCTRAQMATFLWRAAGSPDPVGKSHPFADVPADAYYAKAVQWAYEKGITGGTSATTYSPDEFCTRGQMATFLWRNAGAPAPVSGANQFADVLADQYCAAAVQWAYEQKITSGTSATTFNLNDPCTRAQMVTFLYRFFVK